VADGVGEDDVLVSSCKKETYVKAYILVLK